MRESIQAAPASLPVTQAEAKAHCRIDFDDENDLIDRLIAQATEHVEEVLGKRIMEQTWEVFYDGVGRPDKIALPQAPVKSVTSISYIDTDGQSQTDTVSNYHLVKDGDRAHLEPKNGFAWPAVADQPNSRSVRYLVGYSSVPERVRGAILLLIAHWYENREAVTFGVVSANLEMAVENLLATERRHWVRG